MQQPLNALVTGGLQGIGRAIVDCLIQRGDEVVVFDCVDQQDDRVQSLLTQSNVSYQRVDVSSVASIVEGFAGLSDQIHLLVNNAGVTRDGLAVRMQEQDWDVVMNVNLKGSFFCAQQAIKRMMRQKPLVDRQSRGYIVNISSIVAQTGNPGQANYAASKAGLIALTKSLAQEYAARGIYVNAVVPGFIQTPMTEKLPECVKTYAQERIALKRFGTVEDVARMVAFLSSGNADYSTGQIFDVTGGMF